MNNEIATTEAEANEATTRYWFTEGWLGDYATADKIFSDRFSTNGITVGTEGPKRNIENRLTGFPDLRTFVEEVLAVDDKVVVRLRWTGTHTGPYSGAPATGKPVDVRVISIWRFVDGKVEENWTIQDQFTLFQQVGIVAPDLTTAQVPRQSRLLPFSTEPHGRTDGSARYSGSRRGIRSTALEGRLA